MSRDAGDRGRIILRVDGQGEGRAVAGRAVGDAHGDHRRAGLIRGRGDDQAAIGPGADGKNVRVGQQRRVARDGGDHQRSEGRIHVGHVDGGERGRSIFVERDAGDRRDGGRIVHRVDRDVEGKIAEAEGGINDRERDGRSAEEVGHRREGEGAVGLGSAEDEVVRRQQRGVRRHGDQAEVARGGLRVAHGEGQRPGGGVLVDREVGQAREGGKHIVVVLDVREETVGDARAAAVGDDHRDGVGADVIAGPERERAVGGAAGVVHGGSGHQAGVAGGSRDGDGLVLVACSTTDAAKRHDVGWAATHLVRHEIADGIDGGQIVHGAHRQRETPTGRARAVRGDKRDEVRAAQIARRGDGHAAICPGSAEHDVRGWHQGGVRGTS